MMVKCELFLMRNCGNVPKSKLAVPMKMLAVVATTAFVCASVFARGGTSEMNGDHFNAIESNLLRMLGLKSKPMINKNKMFVPRTMLDIYDGRMQSIREPRSLPLAGKLTGPANTVRSFTHQESFVDDKFQRNEQFRLNFNLKDFPIDENVISAELQLSIVPEEEKANISRNEFVIFVKDIVLPGIGEETEPILRLIDTRYVNVNEKQTVNLDVLPIVRRWLSHPNQNFGILVNIEWTPSTKVTSATAAAAAAASHVRLKRNVNYESWQYVQPILFIYSDDMVNRKSLDWEHYIREKRSKRSSSNGSGKKKPNPKNHCRRQKLFIDFESMGWNDWIISPRGYEAYYCAGECAAQYPDGANVSNHAIIQSLVHSIHPTVIPKPCCVPTKLSPHPVLYLLEDSRSLVTTYPDMVVESCGCR